MATKTNTKSRKPARKQQPDSGTEQDSALRDFFTDELKDIYWAEKHLVKSLPKLQKAASSEDLKNAIGNHLEETKEHVTRLEKVFSMLGEKPQAKKCDAMAGLVEEGSGVIDDTEKGTATRDVGIILASQKVEHYEIATYGGLCQLARTLGLDDIKDVLGETLEEEKNADELLTSIAESNVNAQAREELA